MMVFAPGDAVRDRFCSDLVGVVVARYEGEKLVYAVRWDSGYTFIVDAENLRPR